MFIKDKTNFACRMSGNERRMSILASCCLRPIMRNSVLEKLGVRRLADIQEEISCRAVWGWEILESKLRGWKEKKVEYHLHKGGGLEKVRR